MFGSYIAIGDSFTEGLGDQRPDGTLRGWSDLLAEGLAEAHASVRGADDPAFRYANLAIRGRKIEAIIAEQIEPALQQRPELISFNAGGNNMLRPKFSAEEALAESLGAVEKLVAGGSHVLLLAGPDPVNNLPFGKVFSERGGRFTALAKEETRGMSGVTFVDNFSDRAFEDSTYWSEDGLHLSGAGHLRVAANCLEALDLQFPAGWDDPWDPTPNRKNYRSARYLSTYVAPWIGRRLTGRSSGDGRTAKRPLLTEVKVHRKD